jgi:glucose-6-phosphate dehydrogenase assembly protein OpcA
MRGWLASRLGIAPELVPTDEFRRMRSVELTCASGECLTLTRENGHAVFSRPHQPDRIMALPRRPLGDELAEELRRLDADQIYADALGAMAGIDGLDGRPAHRVHIWKDPVAATSGTASTGAPGATS